MEWLQHSPWWSDVGLRHAPVVLTLQMGGHLGRHGAGLWIHSERPKHQKVSRLYHSGQNISMSLIIMITNEDLSTESLLINEISTQSFVASVYKWLTHNMCWQHVYDHNMPTGFLKSLDHLHGTYYLKFPGCSDHVIKKWGPNLGGVIMSVGAQVIKLQRWINFKPHL